ncbi:MAG: hypothetical protein IJ929_07345 [Prevotella sp.]|nr:hypothetical protein [Prevotella sp.]
MTLHIFNPEHDIALASNLSNFTAPRAGRQLRTDLWWMPRLWAQENDVVWMKGVQLGGLPITAVEPWGWDRAICAELRRAGVKDEVLPTDEMVQHIRQLSHRRTSAQLLPLLQMEGTVGEAFECKTVEEVTELMQRYGRLVLKAPWSSSGRGVRFCENEKGEMRNENWVRNVIKAQGSMMAEPYYNKVKDFGMEFEADAEGRIHYLGLSLFHTVNGAYEGNILATESVKREMISRYIPISLLDSVKQRIVERLHLDGYIGPFGIDMMIVKSIGNGNHNSQLSIVNCQLGLHPCVEINLRRTMGHVALSISPTDDDIRGVMRVVYDGNHYNLRIEPLKQR